MPRACFGLLSAVDASFRLVGDSYSASRLRHSVNRSMRVAPGPASVDTELARVLHTALSHQLHPRWHLLLNVIACALVPTAPIWLRSPRVATSLVLPVHVPFPPQPLSPLHPHRHCCHPPRFRCTPSSSPPMRPLLPLRRHRRPPPAPPIHPSPSALPSPPSPL